MILRNGVDLVEIQRFADLQPGIRSRFILRVLTQDEQSEVNGSLPSLAGKFAAKEAVAKALGCGIGAISWKDIEILHDDSGQPELRLYRHALQMANELMLTRWSVSISHTKQLAIATAVFIGE